MKKTGGNGGYKNRVDHGRMCTLKGANPRTPKPGGQPTQRMTKKRAQDGSRANAKQ